MTDHVTRPSRPRRPTRDISSVPLIADTEQFKDLVEEDVDVLYDGSQTDHSTKLTPVRAHYLKKALIQLQFNRELDTITSSPPGNISTLSYLGSPFTPPPKNAPIIHLPFLKYIFRQFVLTFPFLQAPKSFFPDKLQPFVISMLSRNLSPVSVMDDDTENVALANRLKLLGKVERSLSVLLVSGVKLVEPERVVRLSQADLNRLEMLVQKRMAREKKLKDSFEINVVCVRTVVDKGRVRSRAHDEFIIRTCRRNQRDIFVARRHGDFRTLANELRKAHPEEEIRSPPAKDRTYVAALQSPVVSSPVTSSSPDPTAPQNLYMNEDEFSPPSPTPFSPHRLAREKNRLTLRAYLHTLLSSSTLASSPVLMSFLVSGPTTLSPSETEDAKKREEADAAKEESRKKFAKEIAGRVDGLREAMKSVKGDLMGKDGLTRVFGTIKVTSDIRQLPPNYQAVIEWARISLASTVFHHFVASDDASESFASLKRIHGLMPYFMMKTALKISNPVGMIRTILDLFLAQPFGGKSLLQRMFTSSLAEEVKSLEEDIAVVKEKVDDPMICEKIRIFIYAPPEIQAFYKAESVAEQMNLLAIVLRSSEAPLLSRPQMFRVAKCYSAYQEYLKQRRNLEDSDDDDGPQDEDAWLFEDLALLGKLYSRLRGKEQLIALIFEGVTAELLKDIITIFYAPLAQVYKAASIGDSFGDLQTFINDLIRTVEQTEEFNQVDPQRTVQLFIDLIQRHEQMFYSFVHKVHSRGDGLFDNLMKWIELILTVMREGLGEPISLEYILPHMGKEREDIMKEVDQVATYHYKKKVAHEDKVRRRFDRTQGQRNADEATAALVQGAANDFSLGDLVQNDADEFVDTSDSEEEGSESSVEYASDDSEESEEESEEDASSLAQTARLSRSKSATAPVSAARRPSFSHTQSTPRTSGSMDRHASFGKEGQIRPSRSMNFHQSKKPSITTPPVPPPPIPQHLLPTPQKPPPPSLWVSTSKNSPVSPMTNGPTKVVGPSRDRRLPPSPTKRKKRIVQIKPPELHHIPQLLPVFVEMLTPQLKVKR